MNLENIESEWEVFAREGERGIGGVRRVERHGLLIHIQNFGEVTLPLSDVADAHDGKVILRAGCLTADIENAIQHAHDQEAGPVRPKE